MVMVGVKAARVGGPGVPGKLSAAPLNFHCPYGVMMRNKKTKNRETEQNKRQKKRGKSNWIAQIKKKDKEKLLTKMKAARKGG